MLGNETSPARALLLTAIAVTAAVAVACGGGGGNAGAGAPKSASTTAPAAAKSTTAPAAATSTTAAAPEKAAPGAASAAAASNDPIAKGKVVFQQTAGGTGCALCHGMEGRGDGAANLGAPNIRGADISKIRGALTGGVPVMGYIKLTEDELEAVAAFVKSLGGQ